MSTILNTLKKLEEEKSVMEQPLDIKGLVTQGDIGHSSSTHITFRLGWVTSSILFFAIIGGSWYFLFNPQSSSVSTYIKPPTLQEPILSVPSKPPNEFKTIKGISMDGIQEREKANQLTPIKENSLKESIPPENNKPLENSKSGLTSIKDILPILESAPETPNHKIKNLLKNAQLLAVNQTLLEKPVVQANGHIPGLSIKGIIFFSDGNPSNYIFASTAEDDSQKLKTGDRIQGAILESIHADHVIFKNQDRLIVVGIGG